MTVNELITLLDGYSQSQEHDGTREVQSGYVCDLLSWVMSHGAAGAAWVTVQTHLNVIAVATLLDFSCVILPEGIKMDPNALEKASEEGVAVISTAKTAYEICGLMRDNGIPETKRL